MNVAHARARAQLRLRISKCTDCRLRMCATHPVPWSGPTPNDIVIVGQAPGRTEDERGEPFIGPAGKLLRAILIGAGIEPTECVITNTVACYPPEDRPPYEDEMRACAGNLADTITLADPTWVLCFGATAMSAFRDDAKVGDLAGRWWFWPRGGWNAQSFGEHFMVGFHHPSWALRAPNGKKVLVDEVESWIAFKSHVEAGGLSLDHLSETCCKCGDPVHDYDVTGTAWCAWHFENIAKPYWDARVEMTTKRRRRSKFIVGQQSITDVGVDIAVPPVIVKDPT